MSKLLICSDIHGDAQSAQMIINAFEESGAERLVILGDILYHGPRNDLPPGYAPKKVIELFNKYSSKILAVRGNCDAEVDQMVLDFPILANYAYIEVDELRIFATHGHRFDKASAPVKKGEILLHGHTHVPTVEAFGEGNYYINCGSTSIPKENSPKSYILYEDGCFSFRTLEGVEYKKFSPQGFGK